MLDIIQVDKAASIGWLNRGNIFSETEGFMCAIEDRVIPTRSYLKYTVEDPGITTTHFRMCNEKHDNVEHFISGCNTVASQENTDHIELTLI